MAVYTKLEQGEVAEFISRYPVSELVSFTPIAEGIENSNYLIQTTGDKFILTIYEKRVNQNDLPFFISLVEHFKRNGINCPVMLSDRERLIVQELKGKKACLITFLNGKDVKVFEDTHIQQLGAEVAKMHLATAGFKLARTNDLGLKAWVKLFEKIGFKADEFKPGLTKLIEDEIYFLAANWPFNLPSGVIHADIFPDNVFFNDGVLSGVIDFYFSCNDFFAYDLAICINAWGIEKDTVKKAIFFNSYETIRELSSAEKAALPVLQRGAAIRFLLTRLYDWFNTPDDALVKKKDPGEYLAQARIFSKP